MCIIFHFKRENFETNYHDNLNVRVDTSTSQQACKRHLLTQRLAPDSSSERKIVHRKAPFEDLIYFTPQSEASQLRHILHSQEAVQLVQESVKPEKKR